MTTTSGSWSEARARGADQEHGEADQDRRAGSVERQPVRDPTPWARGSPDLEAHQHPAGVTADPAVAPGTVPALPVRTRAAARAGSAALAAHRAAQVELAPVPSDALPSGASAGTSGHGSRTAARRE